MNQINLNNNTLAADKHLKRHTGEIKRVGVVFAMEAEASGLIRALRLESKEFSHDGFTFQAFTGHVGSVEVIVSLNGKDKRYNVDRVGTESSIINTHRLCSTFKPNIIINAGTAGGFRNKGANIADVFFSDQEVSFHDHRISIPGFNQFGIGRYPCQPVKTIPSLLSIKPARISTGNSLDLSEADSKAMEILGTDIKEMEAAAIAQVADDHEISFLAFKAVTDFIDSPASTTEDFLVNLASASDAITKCMIEFFEFVKNGKNLEEL